MKNEIIKKENCFNYFIKKTPWNFRPMNGASQQKMIRNSIAGILIFFSTFSMFL